MARSFLKVIVVTVCVGLAIPFCAASRLVHNQDSEVINAAMGAFYKPGKWRAAEWREGDFIAIQLAKSSDRAPFTSAFDLIVECCQRDSGRRAELAKLMALKKANTFADRKSSAPMIELAKLDLDPKLLVKEINSPEEGAFSYHEIKARNREGKKGTIRTVAGLTAPSYSKDGQFAILSVSAPWSIHGASITFLLRRVGAKWNVIHVEPVFYF